ncbi:hypothetical protein [Trichlorobacter lovleyi]|uniref:hypothetical protein n=1 Tax=Trichlorobacter lovleyi TaxID=313985 RepID=UPI002FDE22F2
MAKIKFDNRLEAETVDRIKSMAERDNISIDDLLMNALDSHEKIQRDPEILSDRLATMEKALIDFINVTGPHLLKIRTQNAMNFQSLDYMLMYAADGPMLAKWPQERQRLLTKYGITKNGGEDKK